MFELFNRRIIKFVSHFFRQNIKPVFSESCPSRSISPLPSLHTRVSPLSIQFPLSHSPIHPIFDFIAPFTEVHSLFAIWTCDWEVLRGSKPILIRWSKLIRSWRFISLFPFWLQVKFYCWRQNGNEFAHSFLHIGRPAWEWNGSTLDYDFTVGESESFDWSEGVSFQGFKSN